MIYFTADLHFGHAKVIEFCNRPFTNVETMEHGLISNWNKIVRPQDTVYVLGDFSFCKRQHTTYIISQLNGKIIFIKGNHDHKKNFPTGTEMPEMLTIKVTSDELKLRKKNITLCHYPLAIWNKRQYGAWHLHGHSHGTFIPSNNQSDHHFEGLDKNMFFKANNILDVGVDVHNYRPISLSEVNDYFKYKAKGYGEEDV